MWDIRPLLYQLLAFTLLDLIHNGMNVNFTFLTMSYNFPIVPCNDNHHFFSMQLSAIDRARFF